jgi:hypothetical protein
MAPGEDTGTNPVGVPVGVTVLRNEASLEGPNLGLAEAGS